MSHHTIKQKTHSQSIHPASVHHRLFSITGVLESIPASLGERQDTPGTDHHTRLSTTNLIHTVEGRKMQAVLCSSGYSFTLNKWTFSHRELEEDRVYVVIFICN